MLMWPAFVAGRPSVFPDTALYYSEGEYLAGALHLAPLQAQPAGDPTALPDRRGAANVSITIDGGRSPIYGLFLYGLASAGGLWLVAATQAALTALTLYLLFRAVAPHAGWGWFLGWTGLLAAATSAPFFTTFAMPDVFGGVAGAAAVAILVFWDRLSRPARAVAVVLLAFALAVHRANLLATTAATGAGAGLLWALRLPVKRVAARAGVVAAAALAAGLVGALTNGLVAARAGEEVRDPPFLMARILADGPGRRYLDAACTARTLLALCRYRGLPPEDSDTILWSNRRARGLFGVASYDQRLRIEREEARFVLGALGYDPGGELVAATQNAWRQLGLFGVRSPLADPSRFVRDAYWRRTSLPRLIPDSASCATSGRCAPPLDWRALDTLQGPVLALSLLAGLAVAAWTAFGAGLFADLRRGEGDGEFWASDPRARVIATLAVTAAFLLANAFVCGALSAPVPRYQARLVWLLPAVATVCAVACLQPAPRPAPGQRRFWRIISLFRGLVTGSRRLDASAGRL